MVAEPERVTRMQQEVLDKIAAIPGVASAAFTTRLPMGSDRSSTALAVEGKADDGRTPPNRQVKIVSPGMFQTLGTPLVAGRDFTWTDLYDMRDVAIVSENLAREMWGSPAAALGKRVREYYDAKSPWREVVGVAGDVHDDGADQPPPATIYWPAQPHEQLLSMSGYQSRRVSVAIRTERAGTESLLKQVREAVWSVSANLPLAQVRTLDERVRPVDGSNVLHAGDAGDRRGDGAAARSIRTLRCDRVRRVAAAARDRHPAGAWRAGRARSGGCSCGEAWSWWASAWR